jgi:hypothetical protein
MYQQQQEEDVRSSACRPALLYQPPRWRWPAGSFGRANLCLEHNMHASHVAGCAAHAAGPRRRICRRAGRKLLYLVQGLSRALLSASSSADTHGRSSSRPRAAECTWPPTTPSTSPGVAELASCYSATAWANTEGAKVASFFSREISYSTKRSTEIQILRLSAGSCPASPGGGSAAALRPGRQCHAVDRSPYSTRSAGRAMVRRTSASPQFTRASSGHVRFKKKVAGMSAVLWLGRPRRSTFCSTSAPWRRGKDIDFDALRHSLRVRSGKALGGTA